MFGFNKKHSIDYSGYQKIDSLVLAGEQLLKASENNVFDVKLSDYNCSAEAAAIISNLNQAVENYSSAFTYELSKYQSALKSMNIALWEWLPAQWDSISANVCWSQEFRHMLGFVDENDFPNSFAAFQDIIHPDDCVQTMQQFYEHLSGDTDFAVECRLKHNDEGYRYYQISGSPVRSKCGVKLGFIGAARDINNEKTNEFYKHKLTGYEQLISELNKMLGLAGKELNMNISGSQLKLSDELKEVMSLVNKIINAVNDKLNYQMVKFQLITAASKLGLWDMEVVKGDPVNPNNTFYWSDEFRHMLGYSDETDFPNLLNSWSDRLHPDDKEAVIAQLSSHLLDRTGNTPYDLEYRLLTKHGEYRYYHAFGATVRDKQGCALRVAGALEDITDEKNRKIELETDEMRFKLLQKSINLALWDMVVDTSDPADDNNEFWWSDEFRHLLGYKDISDFPDRLSSWSDSLHPHDKEKTLSAFAAHINDKTGKTPYNVEYRIRKKTGEYVWFKADGTTMRDAKGNPLRVVGSVEDITNRLRKNELEHHIANFSEAISKMTDAIGDIINSTHEIAQAQEKNMLASLESEKETSESKVIVSSIKNIASQTSILGINASIEAARSGESGRGFKVVSEEIGRLAHQSKQSADLIESKLKTIQDSVKFISQDIKETYSLVNNQKDVIIQVKDMLDNINSMYSGLVSMIK